MNDFKLGDKVYYKVDSAPFKIVGIRESTVEIEGDWSGGIHNVCQRGWVSYKEIQPYDKTKVTYYIKGKPYRNGKPL